ncbi:putative RNA ligase [Pseudomonas phage Phabio]|uniref:Putative RNA ligase n=1 Tax=Pseudomonas phage Phabio TaxID=2006668 RepID=A0A1Y0T0C6_9CAUD|nr:RNA ligase [Pseudomonas phage Phabio]ARV76938.1 putative RNA ligase [Pseudomonas phage Phabio]
MTEQTKVFDVTPVDVVIAPPQPPVRVVKPLEELSTCSWMLEKDRKLARVVVIDDVVEHKNADKLELCIVGGWQCVSAKGNFKKGDRAVYCEIDSLLPTDYADFNFLENRNSDNRQIKGKRYHRLLTAKLRKELSQGLLIPVPAKFKDAPVDTNLTLELGILKYEGKPTPEQRERDSRPKTAYVRLASWFLKGLSGALLPWPRQLIKSDQDRVQNKSTAFETAKAAGTKFEVTYKLDGSSMTSFLINDEGTLRSGVCSRNYELQLGGKEYSFWDKLRLYIGTTMMRNRRFFETWKWNKVEWVNTSAGVSDNFTEAYTKLKIADKLWKYYQDTGVAITVQGELIGPTIQQNFEGVEDNQYYIYTVYKDGYKEVLPAEAREIVKALGLKYIPLIDEEWVIPEDWTVQDILKMAEGQRAFNQSKQTFREGLVFKGTDEVISWKAISNSYLLWKTKQEEKEAKEAEAAAITEGEGAGIPV